MNPLSEMAKAQDPTALTKEAFDEARKLIDSMEIPRIPFFNYKFIGHKHIGESKTKARERSWKERLFSWPWRPWKKQELYTVIVPNGEYFIIHQHGVIYGHPVDIDKLKKAIENSDSDIIPGNDSIGDRHQPGEQRA